MMAKVITVRKEVFRERFDIVEDKQSDRYLENGQVVARNYQWLTRVNRGRLYQSEARQSDKFRPTLYERQEADVEVDKPYTWYRWRKENEKWAAESTYQGHVSVLWGGNPFYWPFSGKMEAAMANAEAASTTKALLKLKSGKVQVGTMLAEARKTAEMLADNALQLWKALKSAKSGHWSAIPGHLGMSQRSVLSGKFPANRWLEYQYGWKPLVSDIYDLYNKLTDDAQQPFYIFGNQWTPAKGDLQQTPSNGLTVDQKDEGGVKVKLCAKLAMEELHKLGSLGMDNPLQIAWELTPFSFAIDWGIPVGNVLEALTASSGLDFVWGHQSRKSKMRTTMTYRRVSDEFFSMRNNGEFTFTKLVFGRYPFGGFPLPRIYGNENPFSTTRILNAIAVGRQLFSGR